MHRVVTQCRVPDAAFKETSKPRRSDGRSLAPVGADLDASKLDESQLERLMETGAVLSAKDSAALAKQEAVDERIAVEAAKGGK